MPVSPGICAPLPHVFHDKPEHCIAQLRADLAAQAKLLEECEETLSRVLMSDGLEAPDEEGDEGLWMLGFMVGKATYDGVAPVGILKELTDESTALLAKARDLARRVREAK